jgi:hypothetical protein
MSQALSIQYRSSIKELSNMSIKSQTLTHVLKNAYIILASEQSHVLESLISMSESLSRHRVLTRVDTHGRVYISYHISVIYTDTRGCSIACGHIPTAEAEDCDNRGVEAFSPRARVCIACSCNNAREVRELCCYLWRSELLPALCRFNFRCREHHAFLQRVCCLDLCRRRKHGIAS